MLFMARAKSTAALLSSEIAFLSLWLNEASIKQGKFGNLKYLLLLD